MVRPLTLGESTVLALIGQGVGHGWALGTLLAADGEVGRVWSLSRPLTYRAVDVLVERRLVTRRLGSARGGAQRAQLACTAAGKRAAAAWLGAPVAHLRDVRTELLVKLQLLRRAGLDTAPLLARQQEAFAPTVQALTATAGDDPVELWRAEHARAVRRFLEHAAKPAPSGAAPLALRLSARNQLPALVTAVSAGELMATVKVAVSAGQQLSATITREAADELDVAVGDRVLVVVKSTEVMIAKPA